jgi:hypothetical protein
VTYKLEDVGISTGGSSGFASLGAIRQPISNEDVANLFRGGVTSSVRAVAAVGLAQQPPVRDRRLVQQRCSSSTPTSTPARRTSSCAGAASPATTAGCGARSCSTPTPSSASPPRPTRWACPIAERYLIGGIYDVRGFAPRSLGPRLITGASPDGGLQLPAARRQPAGHLEQRGRVPAHQAAGDLGRRVLRHGQRLQPRVALLQRAVERGARRVAQVRPVLPVPSSRSPPACASRSASASAGSRRSARCASSGASRSTSRSPKTRWCSSSPSATSCS